MRFASHAAAAAAAAATLAAFVALLSDRRIGLEKLATTRHCRCGCIVFDIHQLPAALLSLTSVLLLLLLFGSHS